MIDQFLNLEIGNFSYRTTAKFTPLAGLQHELLVNVLFPTDAFNLTAFNMNSTFAIQALYNSVFKELDLNYNQRLISTIKLMDADIIDTLTNYLSVDIKSAFDITYNLVKSFLENWVNESVLRGVYYPSTGLEGTRILKDEMTAFNTYLGTKLMSIYGNRLTALGISMDVNKAIPEELSSEEISASKYIEHMLINTKYAITVHTGMVKEFRELWIKKLPIPYSDMLELWIDKRYFKSKTDEWMIFQNTIFDDFFENDCKINIVDSLHNELFVNPIQSSILGSTNTDAKYALISGLKTIFRHDRAVTANLIQNI